MNIDNIGGDYQFQVDDVFDQQPPPQKSKEQADQEKLEKLRGLMSSSRGRGSHSPFNLKSVLQENQDTLQSTPLTKSFQNQLHMNSSFNIGPSRFTGDGLRDGSKLRFMATT